MEPHHRRSAVLEKLDKKYATGIPISSKAYSMDRSPGGLVPAPVSQYSIVPSPSSENFKIRQMKLGPKLTETLKGKLRLGARILQVGGVEKVFRQNFNVSNGEKLLKASQCYITTTAGPIAGILFISTHKIAFCSEKPIKLSSPSGKLLKIHYKVMIPLAKIKRANESENAKKTKQKYVEIFTKDSFEFWFMGFLNRQKAVKYLQQAISQAPSVAHRDPWMISQ